MDPIQSHHLYPYAIGAEALYVAALQALYRRVTGYEDADDLFLGADFRGPRFTLRVLASETCSCGTDAYVADWLAGQSHAPYCYQSELKNALSEIEDRFGYTNESELFEEVRSDFLAGFPGAAVLEPRDPAAARQYEIARLEIVSRIQRRFGLPACTSPDFCSCGLDERARQMRITFRHAPGCDLMVPGFEHAETRLALWWLRRPARFGRQNQQTSIARFRAIVADCSASLDPGS